MRHIHILSGFSLFACLLAFCGCSTDELPGTEPTDGNGSAAPFTITVSDGGYASPDADPHTRAAENGYQTTFTAGDQIGVFAVKDGAIVSGVNNLCLTAKDNNGSLVWEKENTGLKLPANATYYAYYPYRQTLTGDLVPSASDASDFFANVVSAWTPATDQSTYAKYTAQDLMTGSGTAVKQTDGTYALSFTLAHAMALVVIETPTTKYTLANSSSGTSSSDYTWTAEAPDTRFYDFAPYSPSVGTYRLLVKPAQKSAADLMGSYAATDFGGTTVTKEYAIPQNGITAANYALYKVDNATVIEKQHTLQAGDFYLSDGSLVGKDATLTEAQEAACLGIVYYVGDIKDDNYTLLDSQFPSGTHGLVVSLWDMPAPDNPSSTTMTWTYGGYEYVNNWLGSATWSGAVSRPGSFSSIQVTDKMQGYANTVALEEYNKYVENTGSGKNQNLRVKPIKGLAAFQTAHPAPVSSSGWYWPSICELQQVCWGQGNSSDTSGKSMLNTQIGKVGGTTFVDGGYYSSTEYSDGSGDAWCVGFYDGGVVGYGDKSYYAYRVRPLLAF